MSELVTFDGYDPNSPTLRRGVMRGDCLASLLESRFSTTYFDVALSVRSGDFAVIECPNRDGVLRRMVKQLRVTADGRWWAFCDQAAFQIGRQYRPTAIHRIVALSTLDGPRLPVVGARATADDLARLRRRAAGALAEWERDGVRAGVPFPGLHVVNIPDPTSTDLPTTPDAPGNGLGLPLAPLGVTMKSATRCAFDRPLELEQTVETPKFDEPDTPVNFTVTSRVQGVLLKWEPGGPANTKQIYHVYEHTSQTPFSSATRIWSGKALSFERDLAHGTTRYYWVTAQLNGIESDETPTGNGTEGTPTTAGTVDLEDEAATEVMQISELSPQTLNQGTHFIVDGTFTPSVDGVVELSATYDYLGLPEDSLGNDMAKNLFVKQDNSFQYGVTSQNGDGVNWITQSHSDFFDVVADSEVTFGLLVSNASGTESMQIRNARMKVGFIKR